MIPSRSPPLPICSGWPSSSENFSSSSTPAGSSLTRRGSSSKRTRRRPRSDRWRERAPRARASRTRAPPPTSVRSEVALPPTATAWSGWSNSTPSNRSPISSRSARISDAEGGSLFEVLLGQRSGADLEGADLLDSLGDRAEDHLGGAAADVDDGDLAVDRMAERLGRAEEGEAPLLLLARAPRRRRRPPSRFSFATFSLFLASRIAAVATVLITSAPISSARRTCV